MKMKIKLLIADDHAVVRAGLKAILGFERDFSIVGEAANGSDAVKLAKELSPDVIVMDLMMPQLNGAEATAQIVKDNHDAKVLILTSYGSAEDIRRALDAGASGAVMKTVTNEQLANAIRRVAGGEKVVASEITTAMCIDPPVTRLTARQLDILRSVTRGLTNKDIAKLFGITSSGVKQQLSAVFVKLGAASRSEAIAMRKHLLYKYDPSFAPVHASDNEMPCEYAEEDAEDIDRNEYGEVLSQVAVGAEEDKKPDTGVGERRRHKRPWRHRPVDEEVCARDGHRAVRDESQRPGDRLAKERRGELELKEAILAPHVHAELDCARYDDDEGEYLERVDERRDEYALVLVASAAAVLAELVHRNLAADVPHERKYAVRSKADRDRTDALESDYLDEQPDWYAFAEENRNQLVGGGEEDSQKRSHRYGAAGIERRGRGGHSALRNRPRERASRRTNRTSALEKPLERTARMRLNRLQDEIRREEKRK